MLNQWHKNLMIMKNNQASKWLLKDKEVRRKIQQINNMEKKKDFQQQLMGVVRDCQWLQQNKCKNNKHKLQNSNQGIITKTQKVIKVNQAVEVIKKIRKKNKKNDKNKIQQ